MPVFSLKARAKSTKLRARAASLLSRAMTIGRVPRRFGLVNSSIVHFPDRQCTPGEWYALGGVGGSAWTKTNNMAGGASLNAWALAAQPQVGLAQGGFAVLNTINDMLNAGAFLAMWDAYRITRVHMKIFCTNNVSDSGLNSQLHLSQPTVVYALDNDDAITPAREDVVMSKKGARTHCFSDGKPLTISWVPKVAQAVYGGGVLSAYGQGSPWIDCTNNNTEYYGQKLWWRNIVLPTVVTPSVAYGTNLRFEFSYEVEFKDLVL